MQASRILLASIVAGCAFSQLTPQSQSFDVASIKPHTGPMPRGGGKISVSGSRLSVDLYALSALIRFAYDLKPYQLPGASDLDHTYYDIVADAADGRARTRDEFRPLMQTLLADRFKLRVHREQKDMPVYALVVDAKGPKLKVSEPGSTPVRQGGGTRGRAVTRSCMKCSLETLADLIRDNDGMDRPVVNKTGLTGTYDITLTYVPQNRMPSGLEIPDEADIFTAVKDLGLRLEPQKSSIEFLIIDRSEKPAEN